MLASGEIANPTVIDTPIYNASILTYYERNPEKTPTVVALYSPYGSGVYEEDSWLMEWINENYEPSGSGLYWIFYRLKGN